MSKLKQTMTLTRVAKLAQTSASTVSRVLSNDPRISEATRSRVNKLLKKHHYQPNLFARALKGGRTGQIGVLSTNIGSGFFAEVLQGIDSATRAAEIHMLCSFAHHTEDYFAMAQDMLTSGRVDGAIFIDPPMELFDRKLPPDAAPVVLCASRPLRSDSPWHDVDSVTVDCRAVMKDLVSHLVKQGCRRIIHLSGPDNIYDASARRRAFDAAVKHHPELKSSSIAGHLIESDGERAVARLFRRKHPRPDALICFNDSTAQGVVKGLKSLGVVWKGFIGLSGWDDTPVCRLLNITTVTVPTGILGGEAAQLLIQRIYSDHGKSDSPRRLSLSATVEFRTSTQLRRGGSR